MLYSGYATTYLNLTVNYEVTHPKLGVEYDSMTFQMDCRPEKQNAQIFYISSNIILNALGCQIVYYIR